MSWKSVLNHFDLSDILKDIWYRMDSRYISYRSIKQYLFRNIFFFKVSDAVARYNLPTFGGTDDEIVEKIQRWVQRTLKYVPDQTKFGTPEKWEDLEQEDGKGVLQTMTGDCESGALLIYVMARYHKIPVTSLNYCAGLVTIPGGKVGGHAWVEYKSESQDEWHIIDWCYYPDGTPLYMRQEASADTRYQKRWWKINDFMGDENMANKKVTVSVGEEPKKYDWKITAKKFGLQFLWGAALLLSTILIEALSSFDAPQEWIAYIGLALAFLRALENWLKHSGKV